MLQSHVPHKTANAAIRKPEFVSLVRYRLCHHKQLMLDNEEPTPLEVMLQKKIVQLLSRLNGAQQIEAQYLDDDLWRITDEMPPDAPRQNANFASLWLSGQAAIVQKLQTTKKFCEALAVVRSWPLGLVSEAQLRGHLANAWSLALPEVPELAEAFRTKSYSHVKDTPEGEQRLSPIPVRKKDRRVRLGAVGDTADAAGKS
jgi:hypothetical protein